MSNETIFSKILAKEIPSVPVYEDEDVYAFLDATPVNPGHTLVIPKRASEGLLDAEPETLERLIRAVQKVAKAVKQGMNAEGVNIMQNEGAAAGQKVFHLHFHVIPRYENDGFKHWKGMSYPDDETAEKAAAAIRENL